jgi:urate oxidase
LVRHDYGKARVRVLKVRRRGKVHDVREITVRVALQGAFEESYTRGDNASVLPTDTMKNTVYALARQDPVDRIEGFGLTLARQFLEHRPVARATIELEECPWTRVVVAGRQGREPHPHAFIRAASERWCARVEQDREETRIESGVTGLRVMKTTGSGFAGFPRDQYTTLQETDDRILATDMDAHWRWAEAPSDYAVSSSLARDAMLEVFANDFSPSVQATLHAMAEAALARVPQIGEIRISLPNLHYLRVDLSPFGLDNPGEVFIPTDEPHGLIEATLARE